MDYKLYLGILAVLLGLVGYFHYFKGLINRTTKPHFFSWFVWTLMTYIVLAIQFTSGAGYGIWVTAFTALICTVISVIAFRRGSREYSTLDKTLFGAALLSLALWGLMQDPIAATIILVVADAAAFGITFKKSFYHPEQEAVTMYAFSAMKSTAGLLAVQNYNLNTWLYFAYLITANTVFVVMSIIRKRQLKRV
jgi:hypothetical protein